jgi:hypothetical protein
MKNIFLITSFVFVILVSGCSSTEVLPDGHEATAEHIDEHGSKEKLHIHAGFMVYINDKLVDFSVIMYQLRNKSVHVEDRMGEVIHVHKEGITIGDFFESLGVEFNNTYIAIPVEGTYCNEDYRKLSFYVNGVENNEFENYEIQDSDKILISYGEGGIKKQLESVARLTLTEK